MQEVNNFADELNFLDKPPEISTYTPNPAGRHHISVLGVQTTDENGDLLRVKYGEQSPCVRVRYTIVDTVMIGQNIDSNGDPADFDAAFWKDRVITTDVLLTQKMAFLISNLTVALFGESAVKSVPLRDILNGFNNPSSQFYIPQREVEFKYDAPKIGLIVKHEWKPKSNSPGEYTLRVSSNFIDANKT